MSDVTPRLYRDPPDAGEVTDVEPDPKNPNLRRVRVDGRLVARLAASDLDELGIDAGEAWTAELARGVRERVDRARARRAAMNALARRALSARALTDRLLARGFDAAIVERVVEEARQDGWVNEEALANAVVHETTRSRPAGRALIEKRLADRRVDADVAREAADRAVADVDQTEAAESYARDRLRRMGDVPRETAARRVAGALGRRGFDEELVREVLLRLDLVEPS